MWRVAVVHFFATLGMKVWPDASTFFRRHKLLALFLLWICVAAIFMTFIMGCASTRGQLATKLPLYTYKADIAVTVDGKSFDGMGVTSVEGPKTISLQSKARFDLLRITSCHRSKVEEKVDWQSGWFGLGGKAAKAYTYTYVPLPIEQEAYCPLYIEAYEKREGALDGVIAAWGYVAFRTGESLPAITECNGTRWKFAGISVCQTKAGLEQAISFDRPITRLVANDLCKITQKDDRTFRVRSGNGFCYATFTDGKEKHSLVLLGYEEVLVRGE